MAADVPSKQIAGTAQTVINSTTNITSGNFSGAPTATYDNTTDGAVPRATHASVTAVFPAWGAAPTAGSAIELWGVLQDVDSTTDDTDAPSGTAPGGARPFGSFILAAASALQRRTIVVDMRGVEKVDFYLKNSSGQQMTNNSGTACTVKVRPLSVGVNV